MNKLKYIDALRGIAILLVIMGHANMYGTNDFKGWLRYTIENGQRGVQLFYIASAFTLFLSLTNRKNKESNPNLNFFIRRFFRIAPMYYIGIIYYLLEDGLGTRHLGGEQVAITKAILANVFFVHGFSPYWLNTIVPGGWSIAVEMLFYCLVPFLFARIKNLNSAISFFSISIVAMVLLQVLFEYFQFIPNREISFNYLLYYFPSQIPVFACGLVLFFLIKTPLAEWNVKPLTLLLVTFLGFLKIFTKTYLLFPEHIICAVLFIAFAYVLSKKDFKLFVNIVTIYIGRISYSMYVVHFAVFYWLTKFGLIDLIPKEMSHFRILNYATRYVVGTTLTIIISTVTYQLIEVPFQKLGKLIIKRIEHVLLVKLSHSTKMLSS